MFVCLLRGTICIINNNKLPITILPDFPRVLWTEWNHFKCYIKRMRLTLMRIWWPLEKTNKQTRKTHILLPRVAANSIYLTSCMIQLIQWPNNRRNCKSSSGTTVHTIPKYMDNGQQCTCTHTVPMTVWGQFRAFTLTAFVYLSLTLFHHDWMEVGTSICHCGHIKNLGSSQYGEVPRSLWGRSDINFGTSSI